MSTNEMKTDIENDRSMSDKIDRAVDDPKLEKIRAELKEWLRSEPVEERGSV